MSRERELLGKGMFVEATKAALADQRRSLAAALRERARRADLLAVEAALLGVADKIERGEKM